jgi:transposase
MTSEKAERRRQYSESLKAQVVAECDAPGASVAQVAMSHGINANVVHRWRQLARDALTSARAKTGAFIALPLAAQVAAQVAAPVAASAALAAASTPADIRVELRRGPTAMTISWPDAYKRTPSRPCRAAIADAVQFGRRCRRQLGSAARSRARGSSALVSFTLRVNEGPLDELVGLQVAALRSARCAPTRSSPRSPAMPDAGPLKSSVSISAHRGRRFRLIVDGVSA